MEKLPYDGEAISASQQAVGGAPRRCDGLVWVTGVVRQMGYAVVSYLVRVRVVHEIQISVPRSSRDRS